MQLLDFFKEQKDAAHIYDFVINLSDNELIINTFYCIEKLKLVEQSSLSDNELLAFLELKKTIDIDKFIHLNTLNHKLRSVLRYFLYINFSYWLYLGEEKGL